MSETERMSYEDISIPDSMELIESDSVDDAVEQQEETVQVATEPTDEEPESTESDTPAETDVEAVADEDATENSGEEETPVTLQVDGIDYSEEQLISALKDSTNKQEWQKSNTETAQDIANGRKAIEPLLKFRDRLNENKEMRELIDEYMADTLSEEAQAEYKSLFEFSDGDYPNPFKDELADVTSQLGDAQGQLAIIKLRGEVKKDYKLTEKQADEVIGYAADVHAESGRIITPHEAYKILQFDKLENSDAAEPKKTAAKKKPMPPKTAKKSHGARSITKVKERNYDNIDLTGYDVLGG